MVLVSVIEVSFSSPPCLSSFLHSFVVDVPFLVSFLSPSCCALFLPMWALSELVEHSIDTLAIRFLTTVSIDDVMQHVVQDFVLLLHQSDLLYLFVDHGVLTRFAS